MDSISSKISNDETVGLSASNTGENPHREAPQNDVSYTNSYISPPQRGPRRRRRSRKRGRKKKYFAGATAYNRKRCSERLRRVEVERLLAADYQARVLRMPLSTFITIRWSLTEQGEADIHDRWQRLLNAFRIWCDRKGFEVAHLWVHENPDDGSFNTHIIANVPSSLRSDLRRWLEDQLVAIGDAIDVQPRVAPGWRRDERLKYMLKGTDWVTARRYRLKSVLGWDYNQGSIAFKRSGCSRNILSANK